MPSILDLLDETGDIPRLLRKRAREIPIEEITSKASPGLLYTLGRVLDWPGRQVRGLITGEAESTGVDVLRTLGLVTGQHPGTGAKAAGLGAEFALDPLMLLGGVGTGTKALKLASRAQKLRREVQSLGGYRRLAKSAQVAEDIARYSKAEREAIQAFRGVRKQLAEMGAERKILPSWRAQAEAAVPQRALLQWGIPLTGAGGTLIRGPRTLGALQAIGRGAKALPGAEMLRKLFVPASWGTAEQARRLHEMERLRGLALVGPEKARLEKLLPELVQKSGLPEEEFLGKLAQARESLGKSRSLGVMARQAKAEGDEAVRRITERFLEKRGERLWKQAERFTKPRELRVLQVLAEKKGLLEGLPPATGRIEQITAPFTRSIARAAKEQSRAKEILEALGRREKEFMAAKPPMEGARELVQGQLELAERYRRIEARLRLRAGRALSAMRELQAAGKLTPEAKSQIYRRFGVPEELLVKAANLGGKHQEIRAALISKAQKEFSAQQAGRFRAWAAPRREAMVRSLGKSEGLVSASSPGVQEQIVKLFMGDVARGKRRAQGLEERARRILGKIAQRRAQILAKPLTGREQQRLVRLRLRAGGPFEVRFQNLVAGGKTAKGALRALQRVSPEGVDLAKGLHGALERQWAQQVAMGARAETNRLRAVSKAYMERVLAPEAREWLQKQKLEDEFLGRMAHRMGGGARMVTTREPSQIKRTEELLEVFTDEANQFFAKHKPDLVGHWFQLNPAKSFPQYMANAQTSMAAAKFWDDIARHASVPHVQGQTMPLAEFLAKGPIYRWKGMTLPKDVDRIEELLASKGLAGRGIPADISRQALEMYQRTGSPEEIQKLGDIFRKVTGLWRFGVTVPFPAFVARNLFSDTALSWLHGGADLRALQDAFRLTFKDPTWPQRMAELGLGKTFKTTELKREIFGAVPGKPALKEAHPRVAKTIEAISTPAAKGEMFTRTWHFLSMKRKGMTDLEAAAATRRALLDYGELTEFERRYVKQAIFFWEWPRKVIPALVKAAFEEPRKFAIMSRATTLPSTPRENIPMNEMLRQSAAVPLGKSPQGMPQFLWGMGSPMEEFNKLDITHPAGGAAGLMTAARKLGSQLNPMLQIPLELATGRKLFDSRAILERDQAPAILKAPGLRQLFDVQEETMPSGKTRLRGDPMRLYMLQASPVSRLVNALTQAQNVVSGDDPRRSRLMDLLALLTGVRVKTMDEVDQIRALQDTLRQTALGLIRKGEMGEIPTLFARGEEKSPEAVELLRRQGVLQQLLRRMRPATAGR